jgi:ribosomal protein S19E (S16A)
VKKIPGPREKEGIFKRQKMGSKIQKKGQKSLDNTLQKCYNSLEIGGIGKKVK